MSETESIPFDKAMKLMASKLAVAGLIEGNFTEEGLAAMSDMKDMTSQMAKELMLGIKDNVEDVAAAFKKMAIINPDRHKSAPALPKPGEPKTEHPTAVVIAPPVRSAKLSPEAASKLATFLGCRVSGERNGDQNIVDDECRLRYAALLEEQNRKRKPKKAAVDENQLTLFDFVA